MHLSQDKYGRIIFNSHSFLAWALLLAYFYGVTVTYGNSGIALEARMES